MTTTTVQHQPPRFFRRLIRSINPFMKWMLQSPLHGIVSRSYMLVTVTGRKSGKQYMLPVKYKQEGDVLHVITSAGYTWWKNIREGAPVQIYLRGKAYPAQATASRNPEEINATIQKMYPMFRAEQRANMVPSVAALKFTLQDAS